MIIFGRFFFYMVYSYNEKLRKSVLVFKFVFIIIAYMYYAYICTTRISDILLDIDLKTILDISMQLCWTLGTKMTGNTPST